MEANPLYFEADRGVPLIGAEITPCEPDLDNTSGGNHENTTSRHRQNLPGNLR